MDGVTFAKFIEEVREANLDENVVFGDIFLEFVFVLDDGVFEGDTVRANKIRINNEVIFSIYIAGGRLFIPNFFGI